MSAALDLNAVRDELAAEIAVALGETVLVTTDSRSISPPCVLLGVPSWEVSTARTLRVFLPIHVLAVPPGHGDAVRWMLDRASEITVAVRPTLEGRSGPYDTSERILPAVTILATRDVAFC